MCMCAHAHLECVCVKCKCVCLRGVVGVGDEGGSEVLSPRALTSSVSHVFRFLITNSPHNKFSFFVLITNSPFLWFPLNTCFCVWVWVWV